MNGPIVLTVEEKREREKSVFVVLEGGEPRLGTSSWAVHLSLDPSHPLAQLKPGERYVLKLVPAERAL